MLARLKFKIDGLVNEMLDQLPREIWTDETKTFLDPAMAGGQFLKEIISRLRAAGHSDENIAGRVFGVAEDIIDLNYARKTAKLIGKYGIGSYDFDYEGEFEVKKFDVIVGNPPYNKNIVTRKHSGIYDHEAMNSEKEGYVGFYIKALSDCLKEQGILLFINPGKFLVGAGAYKTRKWIFENFNLTEVHVKPNNTFKDVGVDKLVVVKVVNEKYKNQTKIYSLNGEVTIINATETVNFIVPDFGNQETYNEFVRMNHIERIKPLTSKSVGEYGEKSKIHFSKVKSETHTNKVARSIDNIGNIEYEYTDLKTDTSKYWRVITNMSFANKFAIISPGVEHDHSKCGFIFKSKTDAERFIKWVESDLFNKFWRGLNSTRHTHVVIRLIPDMSKTDL